MSHYGHGRRNNEIRVLICICSISDLGLRPRAKRDSGIFAIFGLVPSLLHLYDFHYYYYYYYSYTLTLTLAMTD